MPKQTGSIDLSAQKQAHDDASKTATNYIRADETGIRIANSNPYNAPTYQHQTANDTEFIVGGVSRALISGNGARFGKEYVSGAQDNESHMELDYHSLEMIDKDGLTYFHVSDLRDATGITTISENFVGNGTSVEFYLSNPAISLVSMTIDDVDVDVTTSQSDVALMDSGNKIQFISAAPNADSKIEVAYTTSAPDMNAATFGWRASGYIGPNSFASGQGIVASANSSTAFGFGTKAIGKGSFSEGFNNIAEGAYAHVEGGGIYSYVDQYGDQSYKNVASGDSSHAEGIDNIASGFAAHVEGGYAFHNTANVGENNAGNIASGNSGHAEGIYTQAIGEASHAQNIGTIASSSGQTAIGVYNVQDDSGNNVFIIGNGTSNSSRSNVLSITMNGYEVFKAHPSSGLVVSSSAPSSNKILASTIHQDSNGSQIGYSQIVFGSNNTLTRSFVVQRGSTTNGLWMSINESGVRNIGVSDPTIWRNAIFGVTNGVVPVSLGGTGQTGTTNANITLSSGASAGIYNVRKWGNVATLFLSNFKFTAAVANNGSHDIGTIPAGYRPANGCFAQVATSNLSGPAYLSVTSAGAVSFTNHSGGSLASGKVVSATITYVVG